MSIRSSPNRSALICGPIAALIGALMLCQSGHNMLNSCSLLQNCMAQEKTQQQEPSRLPTLTAQLESFEPIRAKSQASEKTVKDASYNRLNRIDDREIYPNTSSQILQLHASPTLIQVNPKKFYSSLEPPPLVSSAFVLGTNQSTTGLSKRSLNTGSGSELHITDSDSVDVSESNRIDHDSDCALILKRTYILKSKTHDEWGDKFVFDEQDSDEEKK